MILRDSLINGERVIGLIKTIDVDRIALKLDLKDVLTFRPLGKKAKAMVFEEVDSLKPGDTLKLNFDKIKSCDVSFVDEMIIEVQLYIRQKENLLLLVSNFNKDILDNLEAALALREQKHKDKIQVLSSKERTFEIIGTLEQNLKDTFKLLASRSETTARDVAESFSLEINSASNRLKKIYDAGLSLRREMIDEHGKQHVYFLPL